MSSSTQVADPVEVLAAFHRLLLRRDPALLDLYAADAVHEFPFADRKIAGAEAIRAAFLAGWERSPFAVAGFGETRVHRTTDPEVIVAEYEAITEVKATGKTFAAAIVNVLRARDGRIVSIREYVDPGAGAEERAEAS
jgi:ketosteroid isomerase-like protein